MKSISEETKKVINEEIKNDLEQILINFVGQSNTKETQEQIRHEVHMYFLKINLNYSNLENIINSLFEGK